MEEKVNICDVSFSYHKTERQLSDIKLKISQGECIAIIGGSGCGKSTLTRVINGLIPAFFYGELNGDVIIDGKNIKKLMSWEIGAMVGNVFQDPRSQFFSNEVAGEIAFGCENLGLTHEEIIKRVFTTAKEMEIEELLNKSIYTLSYGMRQKVAICSAKAMEPQIYVFDEPSANLDLNGTYILSELIKKLKKEGKTVIIAEHRLFYLSHIVDRYVLMENGKIIRNYSMEEMKKQDSKMLNGMGLRTLNFQDISIPQKEEQYSMQFYPIKISNLCKKFRNNVLFQDLSFQYNGCEIIALVGSNGVGKSTLGKIIAGLTKETSGKILFDGIQQKYKNRIGKVWYIPQDLDSQLFGENLVDELTTGLKDSKSNKEKALEILKKLGLFLLRDKHPATLSGGQKQRLVLGVAMMRDVPMIILDEPTSGLDFNSMERVRLLIQEQQKKGIKFFIISHDIEFIARTCNRILKMENGKIVEDYYLKDMASLLRSMEYEEGKIWLS